MYKIKNPENERIGNFKKIVNEWILSIRSDELEEYAISTYA
jgi:hypothetical protein